jgi:hypothetical protein
MSGSDFDPRFDRRYQRGWVEGPADAAAPAEPAATSETASGRPTDTTHQGNHEGRIEPEAAGSSGAGSDPGPAARPAADRDAPPGPPSVAGIAPTAAPADAPEDPSARIMRAALRGAWAVALLAILVGAGLMWWLISMRARMYSEPWGTDAMILDALANSIAPSLVTAGVLGVVVLTVVDGVRRAFFRAGSGAGSERPEPGARP